MAPCVVHLNSYGRQLAKGMSWPIRSSDIAAAFSARPEQAIWLSVSRTDTVTWWARHVAAAASGTEVKLASCWYDTGEVARWVDFHRGLRSCDPPAWLGLDDPPLVGCSLSSLPASVMRESGLTKGISAAAFSQAVRMTGPALHESITCRSWRVTLLLEHAARRLVSRVEHRPVKDWKLVHRTSRPVDSAE
jgi:hypothetical protein